MTEQVLKFLSALKVDFRSEKWLLAVSGGPDSVAMLDLLVKAGIELSVAHCNFQLRPEALQEEEFVKAKCQHYGIHFYSRRFETLEVKESSGLSIQEVARNLRYDWFNELAREHNFHRIATAHHLDDSIETYFINLLRGTGLPGLTGIPALNGKLIRPLLFVSRSAILSYLEENNLPFVVDSSNLKNDYLRNRIRNQVFPALEEVRPGFRKAFSSEIQLFQAIRPIIDQEIQAFRESLVTDDNQLLFLPFQELQKNLNKERFILLLRYFGFRDEQIQAALSLQEVQAGKQIMNKEVLVSTSTDGYWIDSRRARPAPGPISIEKDDVLIEGGVNLEIRCSSQEMEDCECFDLEDLTFPLTLRPWKAGDRFIPLGMKGSKKISDLLTDERIPGIQKGEIMVLESAGTIIWVPGVKRSDIALIKKSTKQFWCARIFHSDYKER